jgi:glutathione S-transferase
MYALYYSPGACSMAVHVLLNELGQKVELKNVKEGAAKDELLKHNPRGQVPTLLIDGQPMKEGGAILAWLADAHKSELLPASGYERAKALEWLMWCNASLHPAYSKLFGVKGFSDQKVADAVRDSAVAGIQKLWDEAEARLGKSKYLAGDKMTVGDILLTVIANWNGHFPGLVTLGPNVKRLIGEISARPAYQKALKDEQIEYKAAA